MAAMPTLAQSPAPASSTPANDYIVGPHDVLTITSYDQADLSGKFTVETDGTFTYPLIGRLQVGGLTLRTVEEQLKKQLKDEDYFTNRRSRSWSSSIPSQKIFIVGGVRSPGSYPVSGEMNLIEALARAGSTLPTAAARPSSSISRRGRAPQGRRCRLRTTPRTSCGSTCDSCRTGSSPNNAALRDGDTILVPRAEHLCSGR